MNNGSNEIDILFNEAINIHKSGDLIASEKIYKKILKINDFNFYANHFLGTLLIQKKNFNDSIQFLNKAININPKYPETYNNLGYVFYLLENYKESKNYLEKAIYYNPQYSEAYNNLGNTFLKMNDYKLSEINYNKSIEINPLNFDAFNNLGNLLFYLQRFEESINVYKKSLSINPESTIAYKNIANIYYFEFNDFNNAIRYFQLAINHCSNNEVEILKVKLDESRKELDRNFILDKINQKSICAEVGVAYGNFSKRMYNKNPKELYLIDTWSHGGLSKFINKELINLNLQQMNKVYEDILNEYKDINSVNVLRKKSFDASLSFDNNYFDLIYIDASHIYNDVKSDLDSWFPKIKAYEPFCILICKQDVSGTFTFFISKLASKIFIFSILPAKKDTKFK